MSSFLLALFDHNQSLQHSRFHKFARRGGQLFKNPVNRIQVQKNGRRCSDRFFGACVVTKTVSLLSFLSLSVELSCRSTVWCRAEVGLKRCSTLQQALELAGDSQSESNAPVFHLFAWHLASVCAVDHVM